MAKPEFAHETKQRQQAAKKTRDEKQPRRHEKKDEPPRPSCTEARQQLPRPWLAA
jgi:hypothetical protein